MGRNAFVLDPSTFEYLPIGEEGPEIVYRGLLAGEAEIIAGIGKDTESGSAATYKLLSRCIVDVRGVSLNGEDLKWSDKSCSERIEILKLFRMGWITKLSQLIVSVSVITQEEESSN